MKQSTFNNTDSVLYKITLSIFFFRNSDNCSPFVSKNNKNCHRIAPDRTFSIHFVFARPMFKKISDSSTSVFIVIRYMDWFVRLSLWYKITVLYLLLYSCIFQGRVPKLMAMISSILIQPSVEKDISYINKNWPYFGIPN